MEGKKESLVGTQTNLNTIEEMVRKKVKSIKKVF